MISLTLTGMVLNLVGCIVFHSHKLMHATGGELNPTFPKSNALREQKVKGARETSGFFWNTVTNVVTSLGAILACYLVQWYGNNYATRILTIFLNKGSVGGRLCDGNCCLCCFDCLFLASECQYGKNSSSGYPQEHRREIKTKHQ